MMEQDRSAPDIKARSMFPNTEILRGLFVKSLQCRYTPRTIHAGLICTLRGQRVATPDK